MCYNPKSGKALKISDLRFRAAWPVRVSKR